MGNSQPKPHENPEQEQEQQGGDEEEESESESSSCFTCEICIEPSSASKRFKNTNLCKHRFCQECVAKYIEVKVQDNAAKVKCPEPSCQHHLEPLTCRDIVSPSLFSTWCDRLCENSVLGLEKCYCPNRDCMELVVNECRSWRGKVVKKCKCPNCKKMFCFQCQTAWHAGFRCEESGELRDRNDVLFGQLVEVRKWVRCPGCGQCVERLQGCPVVTCRCKTIFCYKCGKRMTVSGCGCKLGWLNVILHVYFIYYMMIVVLIAVFFILAYRTAASMSKRN